MTNENPREDVPLTFVGQFSFIDVGMKRMRTTVLRHKFVVIAVVYDVHLTNVGPSSTCPSNVF